MVSGGHDGSVRVWDMRMYRVVQEINKCHERKYDEAVMGIALHPDLPFMATAGADCKINICEINLSS